MASSNLREVADCGVPAWKPGETSVVTLSTFDDPAPERMVVHCNFEPFTDWQVVNSSSNVVLRLMQPTFEATVFAFDRLTVPTNVRNPQGHAVMSQWLSHTCICLTVVIVLGILVGARLILAKSHRRVGQKGMSHKRLSVALAIIVSLLVYNICKMSIPETQTDATCCPAGNLTGRFAPTPLAMIRLPNGTLRMYYRSFASAIYLYGNIDAQYVHVAESQDDGYSFISRTDLAEACPSEHGGAGFAAARCRRNDVVFGGSTSAHNFGVSRIRLRADDATSISFVAVGGATTETFPWLNIYTSRDGLHDWHVLQPLAHIRCGYLDSVNRIIYDERARVYRVFTRFNAGKNRRSVMTMFCSEPSLFQCFDVASNRTRWSKWYAVDIPWINDTAVGEREEIYWPGVSLAPGSSHVVLAHSMHRQKNNVSSLRQAGSGLFSSRNGGLTWKRVGGVGYIVGSDIAPWVSNHLDEYGICPFPEFIRSRDDKHDFVFVTSNCAGTSNQSFVHRFRVPRGRWGFAAARDDSSTASLVSTSVKICNDQLAVNVRPMFRTELSSTRDDDRGGSPYVRVALLDAASNRTLAGFALSDCIPLTIDSVSALVRWKNSTSLRTLLDRRVHLLFEFVQMFVFGFEFTE